MAVIAAVMRDFMSGCPSRSSGYRPAAAEVMKRFLQTLPDSKSGDGSENRSTDNKYKPLLSMMHFNGRDRPASRTIDLATISVASVKLDKADRQRTAKHSEGAALGSTRARRERISVRFGPANLGKAKLGYCSNVSN